MRPGLGFPGPVAWGCAGLTQRWAAGKDRGAGQASPGRAQQGGVGGWPGGHWQFPGSHGASVSLWGELGPHLEPRLLPVLVNEVEGDTGHGLQPQHWKKNFLKMSYLCFCLVTVGGNKGAERGREFGELCPGDTFPSSHPGLCPASGTAPSPTQLCTLEVKGTGHCHLSGGDHHVVFTACGLLSGVSGPKSTLWLPW